MSSSDYAALAESLKEQGNASMAEGDAAHAVELYSQARSIIRQTIKNSF
jgi:hypothetical protein